MHPRSCVTPIRHSCLHACPTDCKILSSARSPVPSHSTLPRHRIHAGCAAGQPHCAVPSCRIRRLHRPLPFCHTLPSSARVRSDRHIPCGCTDAEATTEGQGAVVHTALLSDHVVQPSFGIVDELTGIAFSPFPSFIASTETAFSFRIDWTGDTGVPANADCAIIDNDTRVLWLISVDVEDSSIISGVQISSTQNEDPAVSSIPVFPSLSFAPATSALLTPGTTSSSFFNLSKRMRSAWQCRHRVAPHAAGAGL